MAVVASTSAVIATISYVPPFSYYTSTAITYVGGPASTTTVSAIQSSSTTQAASATKTGPVNPTVPPRADDHDFITTYLGIHSLRWVAISQRKKQITHTLVAAIRLIGMRFSSGLS